MHETGRKQGGTVPVSSSVYDQIVNSVADHLRQQGFSSVRANTKGFLQPGTIKWEEDDEGVIPDITGEHNGSLYVFEIETSGHIDARKVEDRWRLLSAHSKRHNGKFYLIIPETKSGYVQAFIERLNVKPELLKLRGIE